MNPIGRWVRRYAPDAWPFIRSKELEIVAGRRTEQIIIRLNYENGQRVSFDIGLSPAASS